MPKIILFFLLLFNISICWSADYHRKINWIDQTQYSDSVNRSFFSFEGNIVKDRSGIPYWFESFDINSINAEVTVIDAVYEPVVDSLMNLNDSVGSELKYTSEIGVSAGRSILRVTILPFIRKATGIEKLVEFTISVNENVKLLKSAVSDYQWKLSSVLESGKWIKISTKSKGIYKITYDQLKTWGFSVPDKVSLYGNGGYMLPVLNKDIRFDDLDAYPVWKGKDNAGKDCLFFYSSGNIRVNENPDTGIFSHSQNFYSTETYFYLSDSGTQLTINKIAELNAISGNTINSYPNYIYYEKELDNLISSGSQWFGEKFNMGSSQTINLVLENPDTSKPALFRISAAGKSSASSSIKAFLNGISMKDIVFNAISASASEDIYADGEVGEFSATLPSENIQVKLTFNASNSSSNAWLDYISVNYQSQLKINADVYFFRGKGVSDQIPVSEFVLEGATSAIKIFDVTDINNTFEIPAVYADGKLRFKSNSEITREYVAFNPGGTIPVPELIETVDNQNLHAAALSEMIIVSNSALLSAANNLADYHRSKDQMTVQVVSPKMIYNEFSGGLPDPSGFRNYFKMCYDLGKQNGKNTLKYVLLMGDGSYDNRNIQGESHNLIPTFQSNNSLSLTESFVTDDFFVFLDENEGGSVGTVDLGIGRIPAFTLDDANAVVDKINKYNSKEAMGNWRNVVTFIGDDGNIADGYTNVHMGQAESMANSVNSTYPAFYTNKIYFDTYKRITSAGGEKYPDVTAAINSQVKSGTLIMNYTGHANEKNLADETVLDIATINSWTNINRLPIFVTATCEYSRFDLDETTAGEHILFNPGGGGVGLFSTTRLVYSGANFVLNSKFFKYIFEKDQYGNNLRLGDVMRLAKSAANTGTNQLNFTLLADPAMQLANPSYQVKTTSINGKNTETDVETIQTLSVVTVKGFVADEQGVKLNNFNGEIIPTVFDKAMQVKTLGNAGQTPMSYTVQNNIIYKGLASVINGEFEFSFFVPKDISYKLDKGKILYYAYNETMDAQGYFDDFYVGGSSNTTISDSNGPQIDLFLNSTSFKDGETVSASSVLLANISDETGINTAGTGIGHDITAILDDDYSNVIVLNDYFQADKDQYTSGKIVFPLTKLAEGEHKIVLKVWDVLNNSSEKEIRFVVKDVFRIETVSCYPNPMTEETTFVFTHNMPDETFDVNLEIFQTTGSRIDIVHSIVGSSGTESQPIVWTPAERQVKMRAGVYIYRITATTNGKVTTGSGRLVYVYR